MIPVIMLYVFDFLLEGRSMADNAALLAAATKPKWKACWRVPTVGSLDESHRW